MTFHTQACVLLEKVGPRRPRPKRLNGAPPEGDFDSVPSLQSPVGMEEQLTPVGSLIVAKKEK